jgi:type II secretory pathway pseudopilin PulG
MKSKPEAGFSVVEALIILVIVAVISAVGLGVWRAHTHRTEMTGDQKSADSKTFTDAAGIYRLTYPSNWRVVMKPSDNNMGTATDSTFPTFIPNDATPLPCNAAGGCGPDHYNGFSVSSYRQSDPDSVFKAGWLPMKKETINGYTAYYKQSFGMRDDYFVIHDDYLLDFSFMEKSAGGLGSFEDSRHADSFSSLVHTIKFLR